MWSTMNRAKDLNFTWLTNDLHKLGYVFENNIHKILWDFEIQTDRLMPARRSNLELTDKKKNIS